MTPKTKKPLSNTTRSAVLALPILLALSLLTPLANATDNPPAAKPIAAKITGQNHTPAIINHFRVNKTDASKLYPGESGNSQSCCVYLPPQWQPGQTVTIEWKKNLNPPPNPTQEPRHPNEPLDEGDADNYSVHRSVVEIPPYSQFKTLLVHFLPCNQVKVAANNAIPYPYNFPRRMEEPKTCPK